MRHAALASASIALAAFAAPAGAVRPAPEGWEIALCPVQHPMLADCRAFLVPWDARELRRSGDGHFRIRPGSPQAAVPSRLICLYAPRMGG